MREEKALNQLYSMFGGTEKSLREGFVLDDGSPESERFFNYTIEDWLHSYDFLSTIFIGVQNGLHAGTVEPTEMEQRVQTVLANAGLNRHVPIPGLLKWFQHPERTYSDIIANSVKLPSIVNDHKELVNMSRAFTKAIVTSATTNSDFETVFDGLTDEEGKPFHPLEICLSTNLFLTPNRDYVGNPLMVQKARIPSGEDILEFHIEGIGYKHTQHTYRFVNEIGELVRSYYSHNGDMPFMGISWLLHQIHPRLLKHIGIDPQKIVYRTIDDPQALATVPIEQFGDLGSYTTPQDLIGIASRSIELSPTTIHNFLLNGRLPSLGLMYITPESMLK